MFDVGFSEILLILVVALIVLGPEKLPKLARTCGALYGMFQRQLSGIKESIERDAALESLRKISADTKSQISDMQAHLADVHADLSGLTNVGQPADVKLESDKPFMLAKSE